MSFVLYGGFKRDMFGWCVKFFGRVGVSFPVGASVGCDEILGFLLNPCFWHLVLLFRIGNRNNFDRKSKIDLD